MLGTFLGYLVTIDVLDVSWITNFKDIVFEENLELSDVETIESVFQRMIDAANLSGSNM